MIIAGILNLRIIQGCTFTALEFQTQDVAGNPVDLTGYNVAAEVRVACGTTVILDLAPAITDAANGTITIPEIDDETTDTLPKGSYQWDLLLEDGSDNRQQILQGRFDIICTITDSGT